MTSNKRAKKDARDRQRRTGERYVAARRRTARRERYFEADCCANCLERLPDEAEALFCSELCSQMAETVRYWRRVVRDGRLEQPDVREAVFTRVAHLLAGGYRKAARRLAAEVRQQAWQRDGGRCVQCGRLGDEIDHIRDDSPDLDNLQLLCRDCHHAKTAERMVPANDDQRAAIDALYATRVQPDAPALLCDDEQRWRKEWSALKKARRQRLLDQMVELGLDVEDFRGASRAEMIAAVDDEMDAMSEPFDPGGWTEDDDSGYGPYSYFAHAMAKDD
jgi:5-methylcytosine-specific restriction endonuclease McrA